MNPNPFHALYQYLSDRFLEVCLRGILGDINRIELDEEWLAIPSDTALTVVKKTCRIERFHSGFGDETFAAVLAVGGVLSVEHGIVNPHICFATLFFDFSCKLITVDFHKDMR